jgi:hypothetical protein
MRTYDKLIATIPGRQSAADVVARARFGALISRLFSG